VRELIKKSVIFHRRPINISKDIDGIDKSFRQDIITANSPFERGAMKYFIEDCERFQTDELIELPKLFPKRN